MENKSRHGGSRPGAGRKPSPLKKQRVNLMLTPDTLNRLYTETRRQGRAADISPVIERLAKTLPPALHRYQQPRGRKPRINPASVEVFEDYID